MVLRALVNTAPCPALAVISPILATQIAGAFASRTGKFNNVAQLFSSAFPADDSRTGAFATRHESRLQLFSFGMLYSLTSP